MSEYPKFIELFGARSELDYVAHSYHRVDSAEDESKVRAEHERWVRETTATRLKMLEMASK